MLKAIRTYKNEHRELFLLASLSLPITLFSIYLRTSLNHEISLIGVFLQVLFTSFISGYIFYFLTTFYPSYLKRNVELENLIPEVYLIAGFVFRLSNTLNHFLKVKLNLEDAKEIYETDNTSNSKIQAVLSISIIQLKDFNQVYQGELKKNFEESFEIAYTDFSLLLLKSQNIQSNYRRVFIDSFEILSILRKTLEIDPDSASNLHLHLKSFISFIYRFNLLVENIVLTRDDSSRYTKDLKVLLSDNHLIDYSKLYP